MKSNVVEITDEGLDRIEHALNARSRALYDKVSEIIKDIMPKIARNVKDNNAVSVLNIKISVGYDKNEELKLKIDSSCKLPAETIEFDATISPDCRQIELF